MFTWVTFLIKYVTLTQNLKCLPSIKSGIYNNWDTFYIFIFDSFYNKIMSEVWTQGSTDD